MQLLVRNKVLDFSVWHMHFSEDVIVAADYGVTLAHLWQTKEDPNNVFFLFNVESVDRANAFMARPESMEIGVKSGVIDGEFHYLDTVSTFSS